MPWQFGSDQSPQLKQKTNINCQKPIDSTGMDNLANDELLHSTHV